MISINFKDHRIPVIYKITNLVNEKIYIGSAKSLYRRHSEYKRVESPKYKASRPIEHAIKRDGFKSFVFEIVEEVDDVAMLIEREQYWIDALKPFDPKIGYNMCRVANSTIGLKYSDETKLKISEKARGRKASGDTRKKLSESLRMRWEAEREAKHLDGGYEPILQIDMDSLEIIEEHKSIIKVMEKLGSRARDSVKSACNGTYRSSRGFYWCYKSEYLISGFEPKPRRSHICSTHYRVIRPVIQISNGKEIARYPSAASAAKAVNGTAQSIGEHCKKDIGAYKGFEWRFLENKEEIQLMKDDAAREHGEIRERESRAIDAYLN